MILSLLLLAQSASATDVNTAQEAAYCSGQQSDQPLRFCLADRKHERADRALAATLLKARRAAVAKRQEIQRFSRTVGGVTLSGDPMRTFEVSQRAWDRSYRQDCRLQGLAVATGNAGTEGVTTNWECEADRILDRVRFLETTFELVE